MCAPQRLDMGVQASECRNGTLCVGFTGFRVCYVAMVQNFHGRGRRATQISRYGGGRDHACNSGGGTPRKVDSCGDDYNIVWAGSHAQSGQLQSRRGFRSLWARVCACEHAGVGHVRRLVSHREVLGCVGKSSCLQQHCSVMGDANKDLAGGISTVFMAKRQQTTREILGRKVGFTMPQVRTSWLVDNGIAWPPARAHNPIK